MRKTGCPCEYKEGVMQIRSWRRKSGLARSDGAQHRLLGFSTWPAVHAPQSSHCVALSRAILCTPISHSLDHFDVLCRGRQLGPTSWIKECSASPMATWIIARGSFASSSQLVIACVWHESYHGVVTDDVSALAWFTLLVSLHMPRGALPWCCIRSRARVLHDVSGTCMVHFVGHSSHAKVCTPLMLHKVKRPWSGLRVASSWWGVKSSVGEAVSDKFYKISASHRKEVTRSDPKLHHLELLHESARTLTATWSPMTPSPEPSWYKS